MHRQYSSSATFRATLSTLFAGFALLVSTMTSAGNIFVVTTTADDGVGSLRQAILGANGVVGYDTVEFNIAEGDCSAAGVCTIDLLTGIDITEGIIIDGTSQPRYGTAPVNTCATDSADSYLRIEVNGPPSTRILQVNSPEPSTIRGVSFGLGFSIAVQSAGAHEIQCNHFGVIGPGTSSFKGGGQYGVLVESSSADAIIGTDGDGVDDKSERNVFGGGTTAIYINGNKRIRVAGNYFGFLADGVTAASNSTSLYIRQGSGFTLVGSNEDGVSDDLEANVFGNSSRGIWLLTNTTTTADYVRIVGNWIGLDAQGGSAPNSTGIRRTNDNVTPVIRGNRIENNSTGVSFENDSALGDSSVCNTFVGNGTGVTHGSTAADLSLLYNWWGAVDGPSGAGAGSGDTVNVTGAGSASFGPWLTSAVEPCPLIFVADFEVGSTMYWNSESP